jgi:hypothetical protein
VIAIDPYRSLTAEKCDEHLAILPGTDGALALAMMHIIIAENLVDRDYIDRYTLGYEQLCERVREYDPVRVAEITGLPAEVIIRLAREYATTTPAVIQAQLRDAAPRRRRAGSADSQLPAGADRGLARGGWWNSALDFGRLWDEYCRAPPSGSDPEQSADDQYVGDWRCAARLAADGSASIVRRRGIRSRMS